MTTKHTPPRKLLLAIARQALIDSGTSPSFADGVIENVTGDYRDTLDHRDEAVKILNNLAASPDLLVALEAALPQIQRFRCTDPNGETCDNPVLQQAREAIAKAKGE